MTIANIIESIYSNLYTLVIGKYFSAAQVGYYTRSFGLQQLPVVNTAEALDKVSYPMLASISDNNEKLKQAYKKLMQQLTYWFTPLLVLLALIAEPFIKILLTDKWLPAVPYFQILCLAGIMYPLNRYNVNILKVKGRSDIKMKLEMIKKGYSIAVILIVVQFGIIPLLYSLLVLNVIEYIINSKVSGKLINYTLKEQVADIAPSIVLSLTAGWTCFFFDEWLINAFSLSAFLRIIIDSVFYLSLYLGISILLKFTALTEFRQLIKQID